MQQGLFDHIDDEHEDDAYDMANGDDMCEELGQAALEAKTNNEYDSENDIKADDFYDTPDPAKFGLFARATGIGKKAPPMRSGERGGESEGARRVLWTGRAMVGAIAILFVVLLGRVVQLQMRPSEDIESRLNSQFSKKTLLERRGTITDRKGRPLAITSVAKRLFVDSKLIKDRGAFSPTVAYELGYDPVWVEKTISKYPDGRYIVLDQRMSDEKLEKYSDLKLAGLATDNRLVRDYPQGKLAGQLVGFVGTEGVGLAGLELKYDKMLSGEAGKFKYLRDAKGKPLWVASDSYEGNEDGKDVRLTIDIAIQQIVAEELKKTVDQHNAKSGIMIVMAPMTGEILAMVNYPQFDPNKFKDQKTEQQLNRAVTNLFEPGSIMKPIVWSGVTQLGRVKPTEKFNTYEGAWRTPYGRRIRDSHPNGTLDWQGVLIKSSNIGMSKAVDRISQKEMYEILNSFGYGQKTGSRLPGEIEGKLNPLKNWNKNYSKHSLSFGQEIGVTGLQMVRAYSAIANGGLLLTPRITMSNETSTGDFLQQRVLSSGVAEFTRETMRRQVQEGGGGKADSDMYEIFGKTGTAQLVNPGKGYFEDRYMSSFVGCAPLDQPRLVVGCFVKDPDKSIAHYGGLVSAPAVRAVIERTLLYMGVPPKGEATDEAVLQTVMNGG
ncbi:peptidoglycan D,D-transpeptidase FtsI family protein [Poriferisphaera sp. WC338]|uniref:peptidoglycan D,D-transpeptidase FtsI family protein n=1 Tax=Poriferisphaera sp. WC338 TaxID=3425129 RepID=UPI003D819430